MWPICMAQCYDARPVAAATRHQEDALAKGQIKGNKEAKKPKADKNQVKTKTSAYQLSQGKSGQATTPLGKKS